MFDIKYQQIEWWKENVAIGDWVKLTYSGRLKMGELVHINEESILIALVDSWQGQWETEDINVRNINDVEIRKPQTVDGAIYELLTQLKDIISDKFVLR